MKREPLSLEEANKRLFRQYWLRLAAALMIYAFVGIAVYVVGNLMLDAYTWQEDEWIYRMAHELVVNRNYYATLYMLIGCAILLPLYMCQPFRYLREITAATRSAYKLDEDMITLSAPLKDFESDLNRLKLERNQSERAAREAEQRKNDLVMYLAHDLKTPLTSVIGYLELLRDEQQISPELRERYLAISLNKAERLEDLINEFFEITRFNLSHLTLEPRPINLTRLLEQLVYEFRPMLAEKGLQCELRIPPDTMLTCDPNKIQRVFDNLLRNAVNYSFENSTITVAAQLEGSGVTLRFINAGPTIPAEKLDRVFEQFYRLDAARTTGSGGAGLGLAIAKEIVELHGGAIMAHSQNETICFTVTLPLTPSAFVRKS